MENAASAQGVPSERVSLGRVLVTGAGGALGSDLVDLLEGRCSLHAATREELDVRDDQALAAAFESSRPDVGFNSAAFHDVDGCEQEGSRAFAVNAVAVKQMAERCGTAGARLVHLSTNYVFDGDRMEPYAERDTPCPRSVYAASKLAGEHMALSYGPRALVVRTAGLYGLRGSAVKGGNFAQRILARARSDGRLTMVSDQRLTPTFTADLAEALVEAVERGAEGVLHLTNAGSCSWLEFAEAILALAGLDVPIEAVPTTPRPGVAPRPLNGVLARGRADELDLRPLRDWNEALEDYMKRAGLTATPVS
jgi:dTDP-4-dehydrorhamnose reductase